MYSRIAELEQLWDLFEKEFKDISGLDFPHLPDVKKLMTAKSVIDMSLHEIYPHAGFIHALTERLLTLRNQHAEDQKIRACCDLWHNILKKRNQIPLKLKHHQRLDGMCDFRFSLQLMEGKASKFKEIQVLDRMNKTEIKEAVKSMHRIDCMVAGVSFADLPLMKDTVLSSLLEFDDVICLIAKDQSDQIIGYCWGMFLRDVKVSSTDKATVFCVMDLAKDPDFVDKDTKIGEQLRIEMFKQLSLRSDYDFVLYQHVLNHKFHMSIISDAQNDEEQILINNQEFTGKTLVKYDDDLGLFFRAHIIRAHNNNYAYPDVKSIKDAVVQACWRAAHSVTDFVFGGIVFFGRAQYQLLTHHLLDRPIEQRLVEQVSNEQAACDRRILKQIILSDKWPQQGLGVFGKRHIPVTVAKLQELVSGDDYDFQLIKLRVGNAGICVTRNKLATLLYKAITVADSPTFVLNTLLRSKETPKDWIELISNGRNLVFKNHKANV